MDNEKIGKQIAILRKERGQTQEALAEILGVSPQAVSKWERGHALPETFLLPPLSKALGISIDALLGEGELHIITAIFGDGIDSADVTSLLNRIIENDGLSLYITAATQQTKVIL